MNTNIYIRILSTDINDSTYVAELDGDIDAETYELFGLNGSSSNGFTIRFTGSFDVEFDYDLMNINANEVVEEFYSNVEAPLTNTILELVNEALNNNTRLLIKLEEERASVEADRAYSKFKDIE